jgi:hypothetical protein
MVLVGDLRVGFDFLFGIDTPAVWIQQVGVGEPRRNRACGRGRRPEPLPEFFAGETNPNEVRVGKPPYRKCRFANARPDRDFKYFSKLVARS